MNNNPPHLLTYPRSGSHYLDKLIYKKTKFHIERSHIVNPIFGADNKKTKRIVTIARDPKESILSYAALEKHISPSTPTRMNEIITEYILLYSFLCEHVDYVIDYQDLVNSPDQVTKRLLEVLEIDEENSYRFFTKINYDSKNYVQSSKDLIGYKRINLDNTNLNLCYFYYNKLLEKKIIL
jgi:hypothetical protein